MGENTADLTCVLSHQGHLETCSIAQEAGDARESMRGHIRVHGHTCTHRHTR